MEDDICIILNPFHHMMKKQSTIEGGTALPLEPLLTVPELASIIRVSRSSIYRLVEARKIPFIKFGGVVRFLRRDLDAYLEAGRTDVIA